LVDWNDPKNIERLNNIFFSYVQKETSRIEQNNIRFVHYTSADTGLKILRNNKVWLRNAIVMNDFSEVHHGERCVAEAWQDDTVGGRLKTLLNSWEAGLDIKVADAYDEFQHDRGTKTFIFSMSEHGDHDTNEDKYGRLSMWRAYGGDTNVAFIFKSEPFLAPSDALNAFISPVIYKSPEDFKPIFFEFIQKLEEEREFIGTLPIEAIIDNICRVFYFAALSTKHPGFAEEKEWRVIHSPTLMPSTVLKASTEVIAGVPQEVYKIPFQNFPDQGLEGATIPELLDRIIIGPTQYSQTIYDAFVSEPERFKGVSDPSSRVIISDIPLRR